MGNSVSTFARIRYNSLVTNTLQMANFRGICLKESQPLERTFAGQVTPLKRTFGRVNAPNKRTFVLNSRALVDSPPLSVKIRFRRLDSFGVVANPQAPVLVFLCAESWRGSGCFPLPFAGPRATTPGSTGGSHHGHLSIDPRLSTPYRRLRERRHRMLIDGRFVAAASGKTLSVYNPANGEVITHVPKPKPRT